MKLFSDRGSIPLGSTNPKNGPSSDCRLQPAYMKLELLVIADQHAAVNTFPGLVHTARGFSNGRRTALEQPAREGESPVSEARADPAGSRVPRDTGNPVGTSGDHSVRLNTTQ